MYNHDGWNVTKLTYFIVDFINHPPLLRFVRGKKFQGSSLPLLISPCMAVSTVADQSANSSE